MHQLSECDSYMHLSFRGICSPQPPLICETGFFFFIPRLGCHQKATASPLQGVVTGQKVKNKNFIHTHIYTSQPLRHTYSHTSVLTRLPSILSHTSSILTISPHIHAWQGHYNPARAQPF